MAWVAAGVSTPNAHRFTEPAELYDLAENMEFPLLLKNELQHAQSGMKLIKSLQVLHETPKGDLPFPGSVSSFIDVREEYRQSDPDSPLAGHFHKKRALIFGNTVATNHIFFSTNPIVGFKTSTFSRGRSFNPLRRWSGLRNHHDHLQLDYDYWNQRTDHQSELLEAAQVLDLEFAAIDYSTRADGTCILWEANPHFALHLWPLGIYSRQRRLSERLRRQHKLLAGFLQELLDR